MQKLILNKNSYLQKFILKYHGNLHIYDTCSYRTILLKCILKLFARALLVATTIFSAVGLAILQSDYVEFTKYFATKSFENLPIPDTTLGLALSLVFIILFVTVWFANLVFAFIALFLAAIFALYISIAYLLSFDAVAKFFKSSFSLVRKSYSSLVIRRHEAKPKKENIFYTMFKSWKNKYCIPIEFEDKKYEADKP